MMTSPEARLASFRELTEEYTHSFEIGTQNGSNISNHVTDRIRMTVSRNSAPNGNLDLGDITEESNAVPVKIVLQRCRG